MVFHTNHNRVICVVLLHYTLQITNYKSSIEIFETLSVSPSPSSESLSFSESPYVILTPCQTDPRCLPNSLSMDSCKSRGLGPFPPWFELYHKPNSLLSSIFLIKLSQGTSRKMFLGFSRGNLHYFSNIIFFLLYFLQR